MSILDGLLEDWRDTYDTMVNASGDIEQQIGELQDRLVRIQEPYRDSLDAIEKNMKPLVFTGGVAQGVRIRYRKAYVRQSWDGKALNGFAAAHPEILEFRKETDVMPSVRFSREDE